MTAAKFDAILLLIAILVMSAMLICEGVQQNATPQAVPTATEVPHLDTGTILATNLQTNTPAIMEPTRGPFWKPQGDYTLTFYCACVKCCGKTDGITFSGAHAEEGLTIAVDPNEIPIGTMVYIEGFGFRVAQDIGGAIDGKHIDIFVTDHQRALELGVQTATVYTADIARRDDP